MQEGIRHGDVAKGTWSSNSDKSIPNKINKKSTDDETDKKKYNKNKINSILTFCESI